MFLFIDVIFSGEPKYVKSDQSSISAFFVKKIGKCPLPNLERFSKLNN